MVTIKNAWSPYSVSNYTFRLTVGVINKLEDRASGDRLV